VLGRGIPVISVNAGGQPYRFFGSFQSVRSDATPSLGYAVFRAIAVSCFRENLADDPGRGALVAQAIVESFCGSRSSGSTRRRFELLTLVPSRSGRPRWKKSWIRPPNPTTRSARRC